MLSPCLPEQDNSCLKHLNYGFYSNCMKLPKSFVFLPCLVFLTANGQEINYDESKVGSYTLPDALHLAGSKRIANHQDWTARQRPVILKLFQENVYGKMPGKPAA